MAIPTREQFDEWLTLAAASLDVACALPDMMEEINPNKVEAFLLAARSQKRRRLDLLWSMPAWTWLSTQREFQRAVRLVFSLNGRAPLSTAIPETAPDKDAHEMIARAARSTTSLNGSEHDQRIDTEIHTRYEVRRLLRQEADSMRGTWVYDSVFALAEYFTNEASEQILDAKRGMSAAAVSLERAIETYLGRIDALEKLALPKVRPRDGMINPLRRIKERGLWLPHQDAFPLNRLDDLSGERLYVYRMCRANKAQTRRAKTEAIAELMGLEGFRHQYDKRTIERLCAGFDGR